MAYRLSITSEAKDNVRDVALYLVSVAQQPRYATAFMDAFDELKDRLRQFPSSYPLASDRALSKKGIRKASFGSYVALYKVEGNLVTILHIFHQRQDYENRI